MSRPALETSSGAVSDSLDLRLRLPGLLRAAGAPALVLALAAGWTLLRGIDHRFISFSDGVYMYAASVSAANGLHELYSNIALSLPPGALIGGTLVWRLSPHIESIRFVLALLGGITALLTYRIARTLCGLGVTAAVVAAFLALTGPVHAQFVGLEGETFLTPLVLMLALALERRHRVACGAILGLGFLFKLTWAPFFFAGVLVVGLSAGWRKALAAGGGALAFALSLYGLALWAFGWSAGQLVAQLVLAQSQSGFQVGLSAGIAAAVIVMWWPLLVLAVPGCRAGADAVRFLTLAGAASALFMLKGGTFFNVLDPLEPFLAILAVAGADALWRRRQPRARSLVVFCALGLAVHVASLGGGPAARALPLPLGSAIVNTDNEAQVDRVVAVLVAHSRPDEPVLVNPLFALVAHRSEPNQAVDWFILRSLQRSCARRPKLDTHCGDWATAKAGRLAVVGVDANVVSFDPSFRRDTGVATRARLTSVDEPPLKTELYGR